MPSNETDRLIQQQQVDSGHDHLSTAADVSLSQSPGSQYYFLNKSNVDYQGGTTATVKDADGGVVIEDTPMHSDPNEFAPRPMIHSRSIMGPSSRQVASERPSAGGGSSSGFWTRLLRKKSVPNSIVERPKPRKAPIKIEPKVFFSNERTFLAWMHLSVILAGASIAILSFTDTTNVVSQIYGVVLLPVAIAFVVYSMVQYQRRAYMIRNRLPGPYEDVVGPTVLCVLLMLSIVVQFGLRLYDLEKH